MTGAHLACIDLVITEVVVGHVAIFIADQAVACHRFRVEIDLDLGIFGNGLQRAGQVIDKEAARFFNIIDIGVEAIPLVGQLFHQRVIVVAHAHADRGHQNALGGILRNRF